jgi:hypothetical protein
MTVTLEKRSLTDLSKIRYEYLFEAGRDRDFQQVMVIRFFGTYQVGHLGASDGLFMYAVGMAAVGAWEPSGIILDLAELNYQWGDEMEMVLNLSTHTRRNDRKQEAFAVVVGASSKNGIIGLCPENYYQGPLQEEMGWGVYEDFEKAWRYVKGICDEA